jgi:hypothetical protein
MKQQSKLSQKQEHLAEQTAHAHAANEFATSEELLRFNAKQTLVPPEIAERLKKSAANIPPPEGPRSWWKNLFGG